jgi:hypothetical protein
MWPMVADGGGGNVHAGRQERSQTPGAQDGPSLQHQIPMTLGPIVFQDHKTRHSPAPADPVAENFSQSREKNGSLQFCPRSNTQGLADRGLNGAVRSLLAKGVELNAGSGNAGTSDYSRAPFGWDRCGRFPAKDGTEGKTMKGIVRGRPRLGIPSGG